ncbi:hypothetical protein AX16_009790 [Volvariella volvacea WC 439]|nr:hypothetical protein AX16_009790 [Volvariella volvacea WC 439]
MSANPNTSVNRPTTPPAQGEPLIQETPRSIRSDAQKLDLTKIRPQIALEMDSEMVTCDVLTFQKAYLPFTPSKTDVDNCLKLLESAHLLQMNPPRWTKFQDSPSRINGLESGVFAPLVDICVALEKYNFVGEGSHDSTRKPRFSYTQDSNRQTASEIPGSNHKIDAFFKPYDYTNRIVENGQYVTSAVAAIVELKRQKGEADIYDNRLKVLAAANHVMNDDPRRMFTYGITIEDESVSLWYFSQSHSAKSYSFNFIQECETFVSVLLSFIFATEKEMGFDPSIDRHDWGEKIFYVIEVDGRYFKTQRTISEYRSLCITGRMTRVWEAIEVESRTNPKDKEGALPVALKDVWLDATAQTEKEIQQAIFADIESFASQLNEPNSEDPPEFTHFNDEMKTKVRDCLQGGAYKRYFLDIICDQRGAISKTVPTSARPQRGLFTLPSTPSRQQSRVSNADPTRGSAEPIRPVSHPLTSRPSPSQPRTFANKRQYRVVLKEVCESLHNLKTFPRLFEVFLECLTALQLLYCAHWVHRDISSGNVLCYERDDGLLHAILGDLEYAKKFLSGTGGTDPKTVSILGNSDFYTFQYTTTYPSLLAAVQLQRTVRYNFEHDLESLWWLSLWFLTARVDYEPCQQFVSSVFVNSFGGYEARLSAFKNPLPGVLILHPELQNLADAIDRVRALLYDAFYRRSGAGLEEDIKTYSKPYADMHYYLTQVLTDISPKAPPLLESWTSQGRPVSTTAPQRKRRRSRNDGDEYQPGSDGGSDGLEISETRSKALKVSRTK